MGEERLQDPLRESFSIATKTEAIKSSDLIRIIVDTSVLSENVMLRTDAWLLNRAGERLMQLA